MNPKACNDSKNVLEDKVIASRGYRRPFKVCSEPPLLLRPQWKWNWAVRNLPGSPPPSTNSSPLVTLITAITDRTLLVLIVMLCVHTKKINKINKLVVKVEGVLIIFKDFCDNAKPQLTFRNYTFLVLLPLLNLKKVLHSELFIPAQLKIIFIFSTCMSIVYKGKSVAADIIKASEAKWYQLWVIMHVLDLREVDRRLAILTTDWIVFIPVRGPWKSIL